MEVYVKILWERKSIYGATLLLSLVSLVVGLQSRFFKITFWLIAAGLLWMIVLSLLFQGRKASGTGRRFFLLISGITLIGLVIFVYSLGVIYFTSIEEPQIEPDCILVLGAGLWGDQPSTILQSRLNRTLEVYGDYGQLPVVVSGGQGPDEWISEAEAMKRYLSEAGIASDLIFKEDLSTSTEENIVFSKALIKELGLGDKVLIVTSDFHNFRAQFLSEEYGIEADVLSANTLIHLKVNYMLREVLAVIKDKIF